MDFSAPKRVLKTVFLMNVLGNNFPKILASI